MLAAAWNCYKITEPKEMAELVDPSTDSNVMVNPKVL